MAPTVYEREISRTALEGGRGEGLDVDSGGRSRESKMRRREEGPN